MTLARVEPDRTPAINGSPVTAIQRTKGGEASYVPHLGFPEVQALAKAAGRAEGNNQGERDQLLIKTMFDGCFMASEALLSGFGLNLSVTYRFLYLRNVIVLVVLGSAVGR